VDPFLTATGRRAHVVLPAATLAEAEGVAQPQHEAWPDWKVVFALARAMGLGAWFPWQSWEEARRAPRVPLPASPELTPRLDPGTRAPLVGTPSGKVELASGLLARAGHPALPEWTPPSLQPSPEFPLRLVTGARTRAYINSQFRRIARIRLLDPEPLLRVHPEAAGAAGLSDGERVAVVSPVGRVELRLSVTTDVRPDVAMMPAGWEDANANLLIDGERRDPISGFPAFRSGVCRLEPVSAARG
jgi:anaerobic selenocysteine-containing dehydrogenase